MSVPAGCRCFHKTVIVVCWVIWIHLASLTIPQEGPFQSVCVCQYPGFALCKGVDSNSIHKWLPSGLVEIPMRFPVCHHLFHPKLMILEIVTSGIWEPQKQLPMILYQPDKKLVMTAEPLVFCDTVFNKHFLSLGVHAGGGLSWELLEIGRPHKIGKGHQKHVQMVCLQQIVDGIVSRSSGLVTSSNYIRLSPFITTVYYTLSAREIKEV